jgi:hypothetical protein
VTVHVTASPAAAVGALAVTEVTVKAPGVEIAAPALNHASNAFAEPAFRAQTCTTCAPPCAGSHVQVFEALHGRLMVHVVPSNSQNWYAYGGMPPVAVAVQVMGVPAGEGKARFAVRDVMDKRGEITGLASRHASTTAGESAVRAQTCTM